VGKQSAPDAGAPIRVAHLTSAHPRHDVRIFLKECRSLAAAGFEVFLIVADGRGSALEDGVHIIDVGRGTRGRAGRALLTAARVFAAARRLRVDICHFHDPELIPWGMLLRLAGAKVVYDAHEDLPRDILTKHYLPFPAVVLRVLSSVVARCELLGIRGVDAVVAATPEILQRLRRASSLSSGVYNFPLNEELLQTGSWDGRELQACYIGGISLNRGARQLAAAAAHCRTRIVLAGPLWDGLTAEAAASLPGWSRLSYRGVISRAEVAGLMGRSRVGLVTFLPVVNHINALPNKLFEYMSAGIPVVASDFPMWREIVTSTGSGLCVDPTDPAAIAAAVDRLAEDTEFAAACGRNGARAVAEEFNWSTQAHKLLELYRDLQPQRKQFLQCDSTSPVRPQTPAGDPASTESRVKR
jgi:glycosyltransferase involved in cell wall biosynthesis